MLGNVIVPVEYKQVHAKDEWSLEIQISNIQFPINVHVPSADAEMM